MSSPAPSGAALVSRLLVGLHDIRNPFGELEVGRLPEGPRQARELTATLLPQSDWPTTAERAVGARLQVSIDVVDIGSNVGITGKTLHD